MTMTKLPDGRSIEHPDWLMINLREVKGARREKLCWLYAKPDDESFGLSVDVTWDKPNVASRRVEQAIVALLREIEASRDGGIF